MKKPTRRQEEVLAFLADFQAGHGYPPTLREVAAHLGFAGPRAAAKHLAALEKKGMIRRAPGLSRGIEVVGLSSAGVEVPILGRVPAGSPDLALVDREGSLLLGPRLAGRGAFLLRVRGDSMTGDGILPGDLALVRPQPEASDGDLVVALVGGDATLKRYRRRGSRISLEPSNPSYRPILLEEGEEARIVGLVAAVIRLLEEKR